MHLHVSWRKIILLIVCEGPLVNPPRGGGQSNAGCPPICLPLWTKRRRFTCSATGWGASRPERWFRASRQEHWAEAWPVLRLRPSDWHPSNQGSRAAALTRLDGSSATSCHIPGPDEAERAWEQSPTGGASTSPPAGHATGPTPSASIDLADEPSRAGSMSARGRSMRRHRHPGLVRLPTPALRGASPPAPAGAGVEARSKQRGRARCAMPACPQRDRRVAAT